MKINSHNEWGDLKEVVVGTIESFSPGLEFPTNRQDPSFIEKAITIAREAYPKWYLDEIGEDLEGLVKIFTDAGIKVLRPKWPENTSLFQTPNWSAAGYDIYNVRDLHIVFGNTLITSSSSAKFRLFEHYAFHDIFYQNYFSEGMRWIFSPVPKLKGDYVQAYQVPLSPIQVSEDMAHKKLSSGLTETFHRLTNDEIMFDAANIIRVGRDIIFLISVTGNEKAAVWLQSVLGEEYRIFQTNCYRSSHLDSTILPLRPGMVLLNGARVNEANCPGIFAKWDKIYFSDVVPVPKEEVIFHKDVRIPASNKLSAMGVNSCLGHISSPWAGLNVFSINEDTVLVHDEQIPLIKKLESRGFTVIPVRMRHCYTILGGLHCSTLDVVRDTVLEDYR